MGAHALTWSWIRIHLLEKLRKNHGLHNLRREQSVLRSSAFPLRVLSDSHYHAAEVSDWLGLGPISQESKL